jgi:choline monooxygenase
MMPAANLTEKEILAIRAPIEEAFGLPRRAYFSNEFYEADVSRVFMSRWIAVAHEASILKAGDALPITFCEMPILLLRDFSGKVRAFHNVSPFDFSEPVMDKQSGLSEITGAYYGWRWSLEGALIDATLFNGKTAVNPKPSKIASADLKSIPCEVRLGFIFINLSEKISTFDNYFAPVQDHFGKLDFTDIEIGLDAAGQPLLNEFEIASNWKIVFENAAPNVYHEAFVHQIYKDSDEVPRVTESGKKRYNEVNDRGLLGLNWKSEDVGGTYGGDEFHPFKMTDGSYRGEGSIVCLYPNIMISITDKFYRSTVFLPKGPEKTAWFTATFFSKESAKNPDLATAREEVQGVFDLARIEDTRICNSVQRGVHSPAFNSFFFSPFWECMQHTFAKLVVDDLEQGPA